MIECIIKDINNIEKAKFCGNEIVVDYEQSYAEGDTINVKSDTKFISASFDESQNQSIVYVPDCKFIYPVPYGKALEAYDEASWTKKGHRISIKPVDANEFYAKRNIALNSIDFKDNEMTYPHAFATAVTRNEPVFEAKNSIDGIKENSCHGKYPYQSWAAGAREDMEYMLYFGTNVEVEEIIFYLRADFPHDTYWKSLSVKFSDNKKISMQFEKTAVGQVLSFETPVITDRIILTDFKQITEELSWAALTQIEVIGRYIEE